MDRRDTRLVFGRLGEVYLSTDRSFVQLRGFPLLNDPDAALRELRKRDPELARRIGYLVGHFDEFGYTPTRQGGCWGFGVERSKTRPWELVTSRERVRVPGKYRGGGLPRRRDGYYTETDVWET